MGRKELRRIILGMILIPLLISTVMLTFNIQPVKAEPKTIIIPDDYPTIQAAVDAASPGDTIIVRAGTYTEKINVTKNHLIIRSESGAEVTNVQAFNLMSENVTINGFAITGGIRIYKFATWANNKIINNTFLSGSSVNVAATYGNIIANNKFIASFLKDYGKILLGLTAGNMIVDNRFEVDKGEQILGFYYGIDVVDSSRNIIMRNVISDAYVGITLGGYSRDNIIKENNLIHCGMLVTARSHNIIENNTVDGKPVLYLENVADETIKGMNVGQVILVNVRRMIVEGLNLTSPTVGIILVNASESKVRNNIVSPEAFVRWAAQNGYFVKQHRGGVHLELSSNNEISENRIALSEFSIDLMLSSNNIIKNNIISMSFTGVSLWKSSHNNIIVYNTFDWVDREFEIVDSNRTMIYLNNFYDDRVIISFHRSFAIWSSPEPLTYTYHGKPFSNHLGNYWRGYAGNDTDEDGIGDAPHILDENNRDYYPLMEPFENYIRLEKPPLGYAIVKDLTGGVWYRVFWELDGGWGPWTSLGGITPRAPSAAFYNGKLYVTINDVTDGIWVGSIDPSSRVFSGWRPLPGLTPSKPTLVSSDHGLILVVRDVSNGIWVYKNSTGEWISLPGLTIDSPAASAVRDILHIVVRGVDGSSLWHGTLNLTNNIFSGWRSLQGLSDATPDLTNNGTHIILMVKATGGDIWMNTYSRGWLGWRPVPGGLTDMGPAAIARYGKLMVMVKDVNSGIWVNVYEGGTWRGWTPIDGLTDLQPELVSTHTPLFPWGKGIWIWRIWELPNNGNLVDIRDRLVTNGIRWVAIKLGDGDELWLDPGHRLRDWLLAQGYSDFSQVVSYFHEVGIQVYGWQYMYSYDKHNNPMYSEVDVAIKILDINGIDGLIIDAEEEFEGQGKGLIAEQYMLAIRSRHPNSFIAYTTFARIDSHLWFPYIEFGRYSDAVMPQAYWADRPTTPQNELNIMKQQWDYWQNIWIQKGYADSVKPILPIGNVCPLTVTSDQIMDFADYAYDIGYTQAISLWEYRCMTDEFWTAYSQAWSS